MKKDKNEVKKMKVASTIINSIFIILTALVVGAVVFAIIALLKAENLFEFMSWVEQIFKSVPKEEAPETSAKIWWAISQI